MIRCLMRRNDAVTMHVNALDNSKRNTDDIVVECCGGSEIYGTCHKAEMGIGEVSIGHYFIEPELLVFDYSSYLNMRLHMVGRTTLPKGVKQKTKKTKPAGPKRGHNLYIPPKKQHLIQQDKVGAEVTKIINEKNEEMVKGQADNAVGRNQTK
ncbi:hypothetical protein TELCIR_09096 [Teladorsagia circumcincta]|uniref:Uncharacterized protein n=1 Tax=Teladorsagia circumcincta TaxID=45464 RepID=A0A2G9UFY3_TELCI|nr:hypothetical protein TELCIR_09096 [Teladorsagia circumcincta]